MKVVSYYVPDGSIRLRIKDEKKIEEDGLLDDGERVLWRGRPQLPFLRWGGLVFYILALGALYFLAFVAKIPFGQVWPLDVFVAAFIVFPLLASLGLFRTEYLITDRRILVVDGLFRRVDEYEFDAFSKRPDVFGYSKASWQPFGLWDVRFLKCADGSMGRTAVNWKCFMSVSRTDKEKIVRILNGHCRYLYGVGVGLG